MKKYITLLITLIFYTISYAQKSSVDNYVQVDSTLLYYLKDNVKKYIDDTLLDIRNCVVDSSNWTMIANRKVYSKRSLTTAFGPDSLVLVFKHLDRGSRVKIYAYLFDYLFELGLTLEYDFKKHADKSINGSIMRIDRYFTEEYQYKIKLLRYFFNLYDHYKMNYLDSNGFNKKDLEYFTNNVTKFGYFRYPNLTKNVLNLTLTRDISYYENNFRASSY